MPRVPIQSMVFVEDMGIVPIQMMSAKKGTVRVNAFVKMVGLGKDVPTLPACAVFQLVVQ